MDAKELINYIPVENSDYKVMHLDRNAEYIDISKVCETYQASYIGEFSAKNRDGGWINLPCSLFYTEEAHPDGSNYFVLYNRPSISGHGTWVIANGISAADNKWTGVLNPETGHILYSAFRHDYQSMEGVVADGGAAYFLATPTNVVDFYIKDGKVFLDEVSTGED